MQTIAKHLFAYLRVNRSSMSLWAGTGYFANSQCPPPKPVGQILMRMIGATATVDLSGPTVCQMIDPLQRRVRQEYRWRRSPRVIDSGTITGRSTPGGAKPFHPSKLRRGGYPSAKLVRLENARLGGTNHDPPESVRGPNLVVPVSNIAALLNFPKLVKCLATAKQVGDRYCWIPAEALALVTREASNQSYHAFEGP